VRIELALRDGLSLVRMAVRVTKRLEDLQQIQVVFGQGHPPFSIRASE
jgi:hypothetical protein